MKRVLVLVAAAAVTLLSLSVGDGADAQTKSKKKAAPPPVVQAAPPPPVVAPAGPIEEPLGKNVQAYAAFQNDIYQLQTSSIATAADLDRAMERASGQNIDALTKGWIAYGALTAAQSPEFVQGVRETAGFYGKEKFMFGVVIDNSYASTLKGHNEAFQMLLEGARADGRRVETAGERFKELGYSLQKQRWGGAVAPQQTQRLQRMRGASASAFERRASPEMAPMLIAAVGAHQPGLNPSGFGGRAFWDTATNPALRTATPGVTIAAATSAPSSAQTGYRLKAHPDRVNAFNSMTTLAALYIMDLTREPSAQADKLLNDGATRNCLSLKQAQFYQCVSAARFHYENAFCLGEHAIKDVGSCIANATSLESTPISTPVAAPPAVAQPNVPPPALPAPSAAPKKNKK